MKGWLIWRAKSWRVQMQVEHKNSPTNGFVIDTGAATNPFDPRNLVPDWFRDLYSAEPETERLVHDYGLHLIGALGNPAKLETCRKWTMREWNFLRALAETWPDIFDQYLVAYAERASVFE